MAVDMGEARICPRRGIRTAQTTFLVLLIVLVAQAAGLPAPAARAQDAAPKGAAEGPIGIDSDGRADADIARRIRQIYAELDGFQSIGVAVRAGVVRLGGTVVNGEVAIAAERLARRVDGVVTVRNGITLETSVGQRLTPALDRLDERLRNALALVPLLALALMALAVIAGAGIWIARPRPLWNRVAPNGFVADLIRQVVRIAFVSAGVIVALDILGATALLGTLLGAAGIVGLAVGFAVRDTIENYVASILLSIRQPFRPNDHVVVDGQEGHVLRLTSRATVLVTFDGNHVRIPNATVFKGVVVNYTRSPDRRFEFELGINADCSIAGALELGQRTIAGLDFVLDEPDPIGHIQQVGDSNVVIWFAAWIDQRVTDFCKARSEAIRLTKRALEDADYDLPEPIFRLRFDGAPPAGLVAAAAGATAGGDGGGDEPSRVLDASKEHTVDEKVQAERRRDDGRDLLDAHAPVE